MNRYGKRCVLYPRVSTEMQVDGYSLEGQKNMLTRFADREEMIVVDTYEDAGKSGKSIEGRPAFQKMLRDIEDGLDIDYILVYKLSRFGRNAADILNSLELVQSYGVNLICIEEGIDSSQTSGKLLISVLSAVAEIERENIIEQTMNGRREKARQGGWNGGFAPYGYTLEDNKLMIEETEAVAIRKIFELYTSSEIGLGGIANQLNLQGIRKIPRQNGTLEDWTGHFIKLILDNPVYCGKIAYGRRTKEKVKGTKNDYQMKRNDDYILTEGQHKGIVSEEIWEKAHAKRLRTGVKQPSKIGRDRVHLLSGLLKCPVCGSPMYTNKHAWTNKDGTYKEIYYYVCSRNRMVRGKHCEYKAMLKKTDIEPMVIEAIREIVRNEEYAQAIKKRIGVQIDTKAVDKELEGYQAKLKEVDLNKTRLEREIDSLPADAKYRERKLHDMTLRLDSLYDVIVELEEKIEDARLRRDAIKQQAITLENIYKIMVNFDCVYNIINDEEKRNVVTALIKEIEIYRNDESEYPLKRIGLNFPVFKDGGEVTELLWDKGNTVETCDHLEEALLKMGILDAIVVEEQYKEQVLVPVKGCEDHYLFAGKPAEGKSLLDVLELNENVNDIFSNQRLTGILSNISYGGEEMVSITSDGTYHMGVLTGTVTGEYQAGYLGVKARERNRLVKIEECKKRIAEIEENIALIQRECEILQQRKCRLEEEYKCLPDDTDMREALNSLMEQEREQEQLRIANRKLEEQLTAFLENIKNKKRAVLEIAEKLYLTCSYEVFFEAKNAAEGYDKALVGLKSDHEMLVHSVRYLKDRKQHLEDLDDDLDQIRYDIAEQERQIKRKQEERESILGQLALTDYEAIRERLDTCVKWLKAFPQELQKQTAEKTQAEDESRQIEKDQKANEDKISLYEHRAGFFAKCYESEKGLAYVKLPDQIVDDVKHIQEYLATDVKGMDKDSVITNLNQVYFENRIFLTDHQLTQSSLFEDFDKEEKIEGFSAKRLDISARYQGIKVSFTSLLTHLEEDILELENLIKDGDRELFEDILANTVSRKIRGKINASNIWVQKMNRLMNGMDTSSGLKLSLRWRSKTAEKEDQLDTRELVELLKKDYRLMSEEEAAKLSSHFRSKVDEARRSARESSGMISFYQIMKETLDYRKWFEFQLFSQKSGERQKELTNSVFGTFSGGEKAMSMYVPLFSAVVAKYQGGREDAPRLISLDEAFAGVDNRNIRDMFRLMTQFGFDFIINSQVLWGDCDTLDALAIYQLIRPENAKFVTVMPYLWNGHGKELLDDEESVEQRGIELETSES